MTVSTGARRTALLLHTLQPADRESLLLQFGTEEQQVLSGLLGELGELGIPHDKVLLDETMAALSAGSTSRKTPRATSPREEGVSNLNVTIAWLDRARPQQISEFLKDESPELISRILACHGWSWGAAVTEQFEPLKRRQIQMLSHSSRQLAPRLTTALLTQLARRLRDTSPTSISEVQTGGSLRASLSAFLRGIGWPRFVFAGERRS